MPVQKASCLYRGNTFYCDYAVAGTGPAAEVRISYNGAELAGRIGDRSAEMAATALLGELVVLEAIAMKVAEATQPEQMRVVLSDGRERRAA